MHKNNFDFLRFLFASFVIITHSYLMVGMVECDWLCKLTSGQLTFSSIGVKGFFIISGFLIFQSLTRSKNLIDYYWKRVLRLYPALIAVLLVTVILVPFVYEDNKASFFANKDVWTYVPRNLTLYRKQYSITGVFEHNPYRGIINGSLWTLPYEFTLYIFLSALFFIKNKVMLLQIILLSIFCLLFVGDVFFIRQLGGHWFILGSKDFLDVSPYFTAGAFLAAIKIDGSKYIRLVLFLSSFFWIIGLILQFSGASSLFLPLVVVCFGSEATPIIKNMVSKVGDLSYGIYITAFPVQQTLVHFFRIDVFQLMLFSLIITSMLAYMSWRFIEAPALRLKSLRPSNYLKCLI